MTDTRTYIRLHDGMPDHPKIDGLSDKAFRLLIASWCWCSRHLTDGAIPERTWSKRGTPAARRELLAAGLVQATEGGVQMHDYLQHQRSAEEVAQLKVARAEAGRRGGKNRARNQANAKQRPKQVLEQTASKVQPSTETESSVPNGTGAEARNSQPLIAEWIEHCGDKRPPGRVVGQVAKHVKEMLDEGIPVADVRAGLAAWHHKGLHAATLPSVVHETRMTAPPLTVVTDPSQLPPVEQTWMRAKR